MGFEGACSVDKSINDDNQQDPAELFFTAKNVTIFIIKSLHLYSMINQYRTFFVDGNYAMHLINSFLDLLLQ